MHRIYCKSKLKYKLKKEDPIENIFFQFADFIYFNK